jgi:hypothetical protein
MKATKPDTRRDAFLKTMKSGLTRSLSPLGGPSAPSEQARLQRLDAAHARVLRYADGAQGRRQLRANAAARPFPGERHGIRPRGSLGLTESATFWV